MIKFNKPEDDFLAEIDKLGNFNDIKTKKSFWIYGLSQDGNVPIGLHYNMEKTGANQIEQELEAFFKANGMDMGFEHHDKEEINIGVRMDIRKNIELATNLIKTIILNIEGALELDSSFRIPGLNKFVSTEPTPE